MLRVLHIATCVAALQKPLMLGKHTVVRSTATADVAQGVATVDLTDLLSTCVDACEHGCAEIRRVAAQLDRNNEGGVRQVDYKIAGDPRSALTAADLAAQLAVVEPLATAWPGLRIVGEEDLACDVGAAADGAVCASPLIEVQPVPGLRRDRCDGARPRIWTGISSSRSLITCATGGPSCSARRPARISAASYGRKPASDRSFGRRGRSRTARACSRRAGLRIQRKSRRP